MLGPGVSAVVGGVDAAAVLSIPTSLLPSADEATARKASMGGVVAFQVAPPSGEVIMPSGEPRRMALEAATRVPSAEQATPVQLANGERVGFQLAPELVEE